MIDIIVDDPQCSEEGMTEIKNVGIKKLDTRKMSQKDADIV